MLEHLPRSLQVLLALERFHLHKVDYFFGNASFDRRYLPQNCGPFRLPCFWIPRKLFYVYGTQSPEANELAVLGEHNGEETLLFPVHPVYLAHFRQFLSNARARDAAHHGPRIWAVPTSSTRTLLAWPDQQPDRALFLKLSLHDEIMGDRHLYRTRVAHSVGVSNLVQRNIGSLPPSWGHLEESLGFVPRGMPDCGVIVRSIPREVKDCSIVLAPLFSLIGGPSNRRPFFFSILERSGIDAHLLLEDVICRQFARLWLEMTMDFGLLFETHGQDLLLALSQDLRPLGQFFYRDFDGLGVDWELRRLRGLPDASDMPSAGSWQETYTSSGLSCGNLISQKLRWSLHGYLHFVLNELDFSVRVWQQFGWLGRYQIPVDGVTMMFSHKMFEALNDLFGVRVAAPYDIYRNQNRFMMTLFNIRKELLH